MSVRKRWVRRLCEQEDRFFRETAMPDCKEIVRTHGTMVWRTVFRLIGGTGRDSDVEDCFQDVFVAALEMSRREEVRNWEALLRRIASTKGLDVLRARKRSSARTVPSVAWEELPDPVATPEEIALRSELASELRDALAQLRPGDAELFCLRHLEEMSYGEIGNELRITESAVGVRLHRIKEKLLEILSSDNSTQREVRDG